ncbi:MAG: hypothetical protein ACRCVU_04865, partial [Flavobacterium sp.]
MKRLIFSKEHIVLMLDTFKKGLITSKDGELKNIFHEYVKALSHDLREAGDDNIVFVVDPSRTLIGYTNAKTNTTKHSANRMIAHLVYITNPNSEFHVLIEEVRKVLISIDGKPIYSFIDDTVNGYEDLLRTNEGVMPKDVVAKLKEEINADNFEAGPPTKTEREPQVFVVKDKTILNLINNYLSEAGLPYLLINDIVPVDVARSLSKTEKAA